MREVSTGAGQRADVKLGDGSVVILGVKSRLKLAARVLLADTPLFRNNAPRATSDEAADDAPAEATSSSMHASVRARVNFHALVRRFSSAMASSVASPITGIDDASLVST